jgi:hypothetical protein
MVNKCLINAHCVQTSEPNVSRKGKRALLSFPPPCAGPVPLILARLQLWQGPALHLSVCLGVGRGPRFGFFFLDVTITGPSSHAGVALANNYSLSSSLIAD